MRTPLMLLIAVIALLLLACGSANQGLPSQAGDYTLQNQSICYDGKSYEFWWADKSGEVHRAESRDVRVVQDERTYLEVEGDRKSVLHVRSDDPIRDCPETRANRGPSWLLIPIPWGGGGPVVIDRRDPGSPQTATQPDDNKPAVGQDTAPAAGTKPAPNAVSGQGSGTGGGTAATDKSKQPSAGQSGGTGSGTAAGSKSGTTSGAGQAGGTGSGSAAGDKSGVTGGKAGGAGSSGAIQGGKAPSAPSAPKVGGGRSGGSSGGRKR